MKKVDIFNKVPLYLKYIKNNIILHKCFIIYPMGIKFGIYNLHNKANNMINKNIEVIPLNFPLFVIKFYKRHSYIFYGKSSKKLL